MRRIARTVLTAVICLTAAACGSIVLGLYFTAYYIAYWWDKHISAVAPVSAAMTPAQVGAGQPALLEFTLPPELAAVALELQATAGEVLPLLPEVYALGGAVPAPAAARAALAARYPGFVPHSGAPGAWPAQDCLRADGRVAALYVAPASGTSVRVWLYAAPAAATASGSAALQPGAPAAGDGGAAPDSPGAGPVGQPPAQGGSGAAPPEGTDRPAPLTGAPADGAAPRSPAGWPALCQVVLEPAEE